MIICGRGIAALNDPSGMNLGGDPSQALIYAQPISRDNKR